MKIVFDGNIGCGKSSIIKFIKDNIPHINVYDEPLDDWHQWLELFYSDMRKYSFGFQMRVLKSHLDKKDIKTGIFERSPLSCQKVFGQLLYEDNMMNQLEWKLCDEFYNSYGWLPDVIIYLRCDPEICHNRINQRNRESENGISIDYLKSIHSKYEELYMNNNDILKNTKVIIIDATQTIDNVINNVIKQL